MPLKEPDYKRSLVMLDITVTVIAKRECWQDCDNYPDILAGFPWCEDTAVTVGRLTDAQQDCLSDYLCGTPDPVTEQINGVTIGTVASGGTNNQVIQNATGVPVGTEANPSIVANSPLSINGSSIGSVAAEASRDITVNLNGSPSGSWDGDSWEVNSVNPSITVGIYSDAGFTNPITSADIGDTVYFKAVPSSLTPVEYLFFYEDSLGVLTEIYRGVNDNTSWLADAAVGVGSIYAFATEDVSNPKAWVGNSKTFELNSNYLLDVVPNAKYAWSVSRRLKATYTGSAFNVRRSSDNAVLDIGFIGEEIDTASLESFCAGTNGFITTIYAQDGDGNLSFLQTVAGSQPQIVASGSTLLKNGKPAAKFSTSFMETINLGATVLDDDSMALSVFNQSVAANKVGGVFEEVAATGWRVISFADTRTNKVGVIYEPTGASQTVLNILAQAAQDTPIIRSYTRVSNTISMYDNSTLQASGSNATTFSAATKFKLGIQTLSSVYHDNTIQELVIYDTDRSAERTTAETNINNFYSIY